MPDASAGVASLIIISFASSRGVLALLLALDQLQGARRGVLTLKERRSCAPTPLQAPGHKRNGLRARRAGERYALTARGGRSGGCGCALQGWPCALLTSPLSRRCRSASNLRLCGGAS